MNRLTWQWFWLEGERSCDRLYTIAMAIPVLDLVNGVPFHFKAWTICVLIAMVGGIACAAFAAVCDERTQATRSAASAGARHE